MLLGAVLLWALNVTVSKYMLEHGWQPLAYGTIRYFAAISLFWAFTYYRERSFRIARADLKLVLLAASMIFVNQLCFVYGLKLGQASTLSLLFGTTPDLRRPARARARGSSDCSARSGSAPRSRSSAWRSSRVAQAAASRPSLRAIFLGIAHRADVGAVTRSRSRR